MKIIFVGLGSIGKRHLNILKKLYDDIDIIAFRSNKNSKNFSGVKNYYDLDKALAQSPDIAFITNPTSLHIKSAIKCAQVGCHLFLEKPLSNNTENIEELINIIEKNNLITLMGCNIRFNPVIKEIKQIISDLENRKLYSYRINCGSYLPDWRPDRDYRKIYSAKEGLGGGVILDLIHEIDYAYWLFGKATDIKAYTGHFSNLKINTEDVAEIILKNKENIIGNIHLDYFRVKAKRIIEIITEDYVIEGNLLNGELNILYKDKDINKVLNFKHEEMYEEQMKYFINCVKEGKKTFNGIKDGYEVLKIALKAKKEGYQ
ncbi:Gfo/Idh/MocA family protein [Halanaerobium congolense]|uniref:Gfo/Idh/MocA family protein n=1 Tax=Halanaerobium congolense TaxID=54121 RepID=UPI00105B8E26|nr:Gfo/Idh/MocA family oxidoreductase [Halanaerobium congolense]TDP26388.1 putative dehydrogenase [Halanaerobium congolense]